jgi:hypothetical protein
MRKYFKCKFIQPKDFLGLDISHPQPGDITLSMKTFSTKMQEVLNIKDTYPGEIITPGRTDKKVVRGQEPEPNTEYRSHVGSLNWLTMGLRYDLAFVTKELSRVLDKPTHTANEIVSRALVYAVRTADAYLRFSHTNMTG